MTTTTTRPSTQALLKRIKERPANIKVGDEAGAIVRDLWPDADRQLRSLAAEGLASMFYAAESAARQTPAPEVLAKRAARKHETHARVRAVVGAAFDSIVSKAVAEKWASLEYQGADGRRRALPLFTLADSEKWSVREAGIAEGGRQRCAYHDRAADLMRAEGVASVDALAVEARAELAELASKVWG